MLLLSSFSLMSRKEATFLLSFALSALCIQSGPLSQCNDNLFKNGSINGQVTWATIAEGWLQLDGDPDINSFGFELPGDLSWSGALEESTDGGTWQNLAAPEKMYQPVNLEIGTRYILEFEYVTHGILNSLPREFLENSGIAVMIGDSLRFETSIDTTPYTWETACFSFVANQAQAQVLFEPTVKWSYMGLDGICLYKDENQVTIDDSTLCLGSEDSFYTVDLSDVSSELEWNDGLGDNVKEINFPGNYWVDITDECGTYREAFTVTAEDCGCKLYIPNSFSPRLVMEDNTFSLNSNCGLKEYKLVIYDRWGNFVFESTDIENSWKGEIGNSKAEGGIYTYKIIYSFLDEEKIEYGSICLVD